MLNRLIKMIKIPATKIANNLKLRLIEKLLLMFKIWFI